MITAAAREAIAPELPLEDYTRAELLDAWRSVKRRRGERFDDVMRNPQIAICIRNIAHARRAKGRGKA